VTPKPTPSNEVPPDLSPQKAYSQLEARYAVPTQARPYGDRIDETTRKQKAFESRLVKWEGVLQNCLKELQLDIPESQPKGTTPQENNTNSIATSSSFFNWR
jgi:hypothetical protein